MRKVTELVYKETTVKRIHLLEILGLQSSSDGSQLQTFLKRQKKNPNYSEDYFAGQHQVKKIWWSLFAFFFFYYQGVQCPILLHSWIPWLIISFCRNHIQSWKVFSSQIKFPELQPWTEMNEIQNVKTDHNREQQLSITTYRDLCFQESIRRS